ncbi:hypothetical protein [Burkholderia ubonensis]|nr:hypothetical protein [Burkholderia ubonensis]
MQDAQGRDMVRLGDTTDHGGKVIEATDELKHPGSRQARKLTGTAAL